VKLCTARARSMIFENFDTLLFPENSECVACDDRDSCFLNVWNRSSIKIENPRKRTRSIGTMTDFFQAAKIQRLCCLCRGSCADGHCPCFRAQTPCATLCGRANATSCCNRDGVYVNEAAEGCNCKKSNCVKNYCMCHAGGRRCSKRCNCSSCHNTQSHADRD
jgi:hypothetical protein